MPRAGELSWGDLDPAGSALLQGISGWSLILEHFLPLTSPWQTLIQLLNSGGDLAQLRAGPVTCFVCSHGFTGISPNKITGSIV